MKKKYLYLSSVAVLLMVVPSCTKEDVQNKIFVSFPRDALEYVLLKEGTKLIYKDSITSKYDTIFVTQSDLDSIFVPESSYSVLGLPATIPAHSTEQFNLVLTKQSGTLKTIWFKGTAQADIEFYSPYVSTETSTMILCEEYDNSRMYCGAFHYAEPLQRIAALTVEGKTYNDVVQISSNFGYEIDHPDFNIRTFYWAKGVGIIKRTIVTTGGVTNSATLVSTD